MPRAGSRRLSTAATAGTWECNPQATTGMASMSLAAASATWWGLSGASAARVSICQGV